MNGRQIPVIKIKHECPSTLWQQVAWGKQAVQNVRTGLTPLVILLWLVLFWKSKKKKKCFQKNTSTFLLYRNVSSTTAKLILFHRCSFHPLKKKMKNKKKFNWHFFSSSLTVSFSEEFHIKWDRTKEGEIQILQETWMWGEKPFRRHDWSAEFVHRECQITLPGGTSNVTPEVSQMGQNVLVVNKNDKCLLFFFCCLFLLFFFPKTLHEWNRALLMSTKPSEHNGGWNPAD